MFSSHHTPRWFSSGAFLLLGLILGTPAIAQTKCPSQLPDLAARLTQDLPDYLNRTYSRHRLHRQAIVASFAELQPLPISRLSDTADLVEQIFVTVRSSVPGQVQTSDTAYWLFVVQTKYGWRLVMAWQRVGKTMPQDVSNGAIAHAVTTWLQDQCPRIINRN
ncbi:MAG: hypothetical protein SFT94_06735 [Pseudanabaenaceae cyanobacterium bins.68]|nr:hypothetical protein [Pseudanabaenaceae cyanobacterium bins.68]